MASDLCERFGRIDVSYELMFDESGRDALRKLFSDFVPTEIVRCPMEGKIVYYGYSEKFFRAAELPIVMTPRYVGKVLANGELFFEIIAEDAPLTPF